MVRTQEERIMALDDFMEPEVAVTAAVAAAVFSPKVRRVVRRGLVYGMAGILIAGDAISSFARNVGQGIQEAGASATDAAHNTMNQAREEVAHTTASAERKTAPRTGTSTTKRPVEDTGGQA
jgi:hypothetical protein